MDDSKLKDGLKWAMLGVGRSCRNVSRGLGFHSNYLHERFSVQKVLTKEFLEMVLGEMGYSLSDFFACMEGRLGDPRIHLARIQKTAEGPPVRAALFPPAKRRKPGKKPPVDIWQLSAARFELTLRLTVRYAGWYACYGETRAERCEGWGVLGVAQWEKGALRHAAYCHLKALELCEQRSQQHALALRRLAHLFGHFQEFELYKECLGQSLALFAAHGNLECVGQVLVNLSAVHGQLGQFQTAFQVARQATHFTSDRRYLFAAFHGAGLCCIELGEISEAQRMAGFCRKTCETDREIFYTEYLSARCLAELEEWNQAINTLQKATNVASYDGIFLGDQLELELVNVRCHLEMRNWRGAELGIERFRRVALLVSRKFANAYSSELHQVIRRRDIPAVVRLQTRLGTHLKHVAGQASI